MKKRILITGFFGLTLFACKKEGNKEVLKQNADAENLQTATTTEKPIQFDENETYNYIAEDGSRADVTYQNDNANHTMTIKANNTKYVLDEKDGDEFTEIYERNGVQANLTKDSLMIIQGDKVFPLGLVK